MRVLFSFWAIILLVVFHEFGHFIAGRIFKIPVSEFSIGFGSLLFQRQGKRETKWSLRAVPLGGYCAFAEEAEAPVQTLEEVSPLKRIAVFFAGPFVNFITCWVLIFLALTVTGIPTPTLVVDSTVAGYPAYGYFEEGDRIVSVNGKEIENPALFNSMIQETAPNYTVEVERDGEIIEVSGELKKVDTNLYDTGIIFKQKPIRIPLRLAFPASFTQTGRYITTLFNTLGRMFTGKISVSNMTSFVGIVNVVSNYAKPGQLPTLLLYLAFISINLGIINLLPIPGLDGSHIVADTILLVTRKKIPDKVFYWASVASVATLMIFAFFLMARDAFTIIGA